MMARIERLLAPRSWKRVIIVMIGGYIDASNTHAAGELLAVIGCAANTDLWPGWEDKWAELLAFSGLERWHHTDFVNKVKRPTRKTTILWNEAEWLVARRMLCDSFEGVRPFVFGQTVRKRDYAELRKSYDFIPEDPYFFLLDRCLWRLTQALFQHPIDDGVLIYCDQDKEESLVHELAEWHTYYLRSDNWRWVEGRDRKIVTAYGSNLDYKPLQAADVFAHEIMRFASNHDDMPFIPSNVDTGSWILEQFKRQKCVFLSQFLNKRMLEAELNGSAFVAGREPGFRYIPPWGGV